MATITQYRDVVTLSDTKLYLRMDQDLTEADIEITTMINSACELIEKYTQVYLKPQSKTYYFGPVDCIRIYDYPINSTTEVLDTDYTVDTLELYSNYTQKISTLKSITANIGHTDTANVKDLFRLACMETVKRWFYGSESETVGSLPESVMNMLASERRFIF